MRYLLATLLGLFCVPTVAFAHGFEQTMQQESNGYLLAVDSASETLAAGSAERIGFDITPKVGIGTPAFSHVWVRIMSPENTLLFAGFIIRSEIGKTGMTFAFPSEGNYEIALRFQDGDRTLAEGSFALSIVPGSAWEGVGLLRGIALLEFFALSVFVFVLATRRKNAAS